MRTDRFAYLEDLESNEGFQDAVKAVGPGDWIKVKPYGQSEWIPEMGWRPGAKSIQNSVKVYATSGIGAASTITIQTRPHDSSFMFPWEKYTAWYNPKLDYMIFCDDECRLIIEANITRVFRWIEDNPNEAVSGRLSDLERRDKSNEAI